LRLQIRVIPSNQRTGNGSWHLREEICGLVVRIANRETLVAKVNAWKQQRYASGARTK
jgi:hypothetical protein